MSKGSTSSDAPFGTLLGYAPGGVAIYSSNYSSLNPQDYPDDATFRSYIGNAYMGHKWQCVEFARRFLFLTYGFVFTDVGMAYEIFSLRFLREVVNDNILPLQAFANGSRRPPIAGSLLIWQKGGEFKHTGHVAVITQLVGNKGENLVVGHGFAQGLHALLLADDNPPVVADLGMCGVTAAHGPFAQIVALQVCTGG